MIRPAYARTHPPPIDPASPCGVLSAWRCLNALAAGVRGDVLVSRAPGPNTAKTSAANGGGPPATSKSSMTLSLSTSFTERTTAITFTVADRDGDGNA